LKCGFLKTADRRKELSNEDFWAELHVIESVNEGILKHESNWLSHVARLYAECALINY
jgi:hypothetical protein